MSNGTQRRMFARPASASTFETLYDIPRFALTVRLKIPWNTEKTSVVAPPMSTPITLIFSSRAMVSMMRPTAPGVGMIGTGDHVMSFL
jgi:hypothetical protein